MTNIFIASDHGGYKLKTTIINTMTDIAFDDCGTYNETSVHYPCIADELCKKIQANPNSCGILICGTGIGISMRANRYTGIRAAVVHNEFTATMAKAHNNANVLCLGGRVLTNDVAMSCINAWLNTSFEGGRHQTRIDLLDADI